MSIQYIDIILREENDRRCAMRELTVSICFVKEWWDRYFHTHFPRPERISDDALDDMYLSRKRFLFEEFGAFGIGEEHPVMDGRYVSLVLKYGMDLIPYLLGAKLACKDAGGYQPTEFSYEQLRKMEPVDIASHPFAKWILEEKDRKIARYGMAGGFLDYESPINIASRLRGMDFFLDLAEDPAFTQHILNLSLETIKNVVRFACETFPPSQYDIIHDFMIGNCSVTMLSPKMYAEAIRPFDTEFARFCGELTKGSADLLLHHCDVEADAFLDAYSVIPNLRKLQASHRTDIAAIARKMPQVAFCAMVSPSEMNNLDSSALTALFERVIRLGGYEVDLWNIDTRTSPAKLREIFDTITVKSKEYNSTVNFDVLPFVWDELEWAYPMYQKG